MGFKLYTTISLLFAFLFIACGDTKTAGSTDVETGGVAGVARHFDGSPAGGTQVRLYPASFSSLQDVTEAESSYLLESIASDSGGFEFSDVPAGAYNLEAYHSGARTRFLAKQIQVSPGESVNADEQILHTPGALLIRFNAQTPELGYFFIEGSSRQVHVEASHISAGEVLLDSIPAGVAVDLKYQAEGMEFEPVTIFSDLLLSPGSITELALP
jgi:hypothetical protein